MNLRDLKPGDRFTAEFEVASTTPAFVLTTTGVRLFLGDLEVAANVTKLPPRARPVRKGDEIASGRLAALYVGTVDLFRIAWDPVPSSPFVINHERNWTHADGAPISWEDSE